VSEALLEIRGLEMQFPLGGGAASWLRRRRTEVLRAVDGVDLHLTAGEMLGLVGESGCEKTTLGRSIVGLHEPTAGTITYRGNELSGKRKRAERRLVQMVFQDP
jgi:ABC-type oligopeptide transport system ATPase subunit